VLQVRDPLHHTESTRFVSGGEKRRNWYRPRREKPGGGGNFRGAHTLRWGEIKNSLVKRPKLSQRASSRALSGGGSDLKMESLAAGRS